MDTITPTAETDDRWIARFIPEHYALHVGARTFAMCFAPVLFFEDYDDDQLFSLTGHSVWEVSFSAESVTADGRRFADYGLTGTGDSFKILGAVAHAILHWCREKRPEYIYWWALDPKRGHLYSAMIRYFAARGSGWQRLATDPFTGLRCRPEAFWVAR